MGENLITVYYDGCLILSKKDINGKKPLLYIIIGNRSGGKTTFFTRKLWNDYIANGDKFLYLVRFKNEIPGAVDNINSVLSNFYKDTVIKSSKLCGGSVAQLEYNKKVCGFITAVNASESVKKNSNLLSSVSQILFDEFVSEVGIYAPKEVIKFMSIYKSIQRGYNKTDRYIPVYMLGNFVDFFNPYFMNMGITKSLEQDRGIVSGNGYVIEFNINNNVKPQNNDITAIFKAAEQYSMLPPKNKIKALTSNCKSFGRIKTEKNIYGVFSDKENNIYISEKNDPSAPLYVTSLEEQGNKFIYSSLFETIRKNYINDMLYFDSLETQKIIVDILHL